MAGNKGLFGIVLAGGQSQRLGRDKCLIELGSEDFVVRTSALIAPFCSQTWIVGRDASRHGLNMPWTLDDYPGKGPLGGILTGLSRARGQACLVLACDLPFMDAATLDELVRCREKRAGKTVMTTFEQSETGSITHLLELDLPFPVLRIYKKFDQRFC
jgi:molybdopterin-guanine dinucleotide biosynthesis protein A